MEFEAHQITKPEDFRIMFDNISDKTSALSQGTEIADRERERVPGGITMKLKDMNKGIYRFVCRNHPNMGGTTITVI